MKRLVLFLPILLLMGCKTKTIIQEVAVPEVHYIDKVQLLHDSVWLHDSVYQTEYLRGDTIVQYKYQQKIQYRDRVKIDTFIKVDSIPFEVTKTVLQVKTNYSGWWAFTLLLLALGVTLYFLIRKR